MKPSVNVYHPEIDRLVKESRARYERQKLLSKLPEKIFLGYLLTCLLLLLCSGCVSTTFEKGDMKMSRTCPMWNQIGIGEVTFYAEDGRVLAQMKGYKNDGSAAAIKELGETLKSAGAALSAAAIEQVK